MVQTLSVNHTSVDRGIDVIVRTKTPLSFYLFPHLCSIMLLLLAHISDIVYDSNRRTLMSKYIGFVLS